MRLTTLLPAALLLLSARGPADTFTVTNTDPGVINGSFVKALADADANPGPDVIAFDLSGTPPFRIQPSTNPTITQQVVIDGRTQPGWAGAPLIELDGSSVGASSLRVTAGGCEIYGLSVYDYPDGIYLAGASFTTIQQCYIGVTADGASANGNGTTADAGAGITVDGGTGNLIGGTPGSGLGNLISGNTCGVRVLGTATDTQVLANLIGTNPAGTGALGTQSNGITVHDASDTLVQENVIAYHVNSGVWVRDPVGGGCCDGMGCTVTRNSIFCNGGLAIQLGHPPFPENDFLDADTGPNGLQNAPLVHDALGYSDHTHIGGMIENAAFTDYTIELFGNTSCTGTGGEAETFLADLVVTTGADGEFDFDFHLFGSNMLSIGTEVRLTVTDASGNTSPVSTTRATVEIAGPILYVDPDAPGSQNGTNWQHAFHDLQEALDFAGLNEDITEIRVARGIYIPWRETVFGDPRSATFAIPDELALRGSFSGWGEPDPDFQDLETHGSVLHGDLGPNDTTGSCPVSHSNFEENAYHVVDLSNTGPTTLLEGFTVTHGNANGNSPYNSGGGIFMFPSDATVRHCTIRNNEATFQGGGVYSAQGGVPTFEACNLWFNMVEVSGGAGMWQSASGLMEMRRCSFRGNLAGGSANGGGLGLSTTQVRLINCEFSENEAGGHGAGVYSGFSFDGFVDARNCTFNRNEAQGNGGGIWCWRNVSARNSIFWGNTGTSGTTADQQMTTNSGSLSVAYCDVEGWTAGGAGNLSQPPRFRDGVSDCIGDTVDLHLFSDSPCIDAGSNSDVPAGTTVDFCGSPRFQDDPLTTDTGSGTAPLVDYGAFEYERDELGNAFCFGDGSNVDCPCGNNVATAGESCRHSGGTGMVITATGSTSIAADDLTIVVTQVPPENGGLIYSGTHALDPPNLIWDGLQCALGDTRRYQPQFQSDGTFTDTGFVAQDPTGTYFAAGVEYHFQLWTRDATQPSACGSGANYSPAYTVRMTP